MSHLRTPPQFHNYWTFNIFYRGNSDDAMKAYPLEIHLHEGHGLVIDVDY